MGSRRHHETSPGGDNETNREHYDRSDRKTDRQERREARQEAREGFRGERDSIRSEIDLSNARLPRRLKIRLAEAEELIAQHEAENLDFDLKDFNAIKSRVDLLGDNFDEGDYEEGGKAPQKNVMRSDLQELRDMIRGLRTSLRRHVNHIEDQDSIAPIIVRPDHGGVNENPEVPNNGNGGGSNEAPDEDKDEDEDKDDEDTKPDPDSSEDLEVRGNREETPEEKVEEKVERESKEKAAREKASEEAEERRKAAEKEALRAKEQEEVAEEEKAEAEEEIKLHDDAVKEFGELVKAINPKYDDEFRAWYGKNNLDTEAIQETIEDLKQNSIPPDTMTKLEESWEKYFNELTKEVNEFLLKDYSEDGKDENGNKTYDGVTEAMIPDVEVFWEYYQKTDEEACIKDLRAILKGHASKEGAEAFERARQKFMTDGFREYLANHESEKEADEKREELSEDPLKWINGAFDSMPEVDKAGMERKGPELENGITLELEGSSLDLTFNDGLWTISTKYPDMFRDGVSLSYEDPSDALVDARKVLREVVFLDEVMRDSAEETPHEDFRHQPIQITASGTLTFKDNSYWLNDTHNWESRPGKYQANHLVDIQSIANAANTAYLADHPYVESLTDWNKGYEGAKKHADAAIALMQERGFGLTITPDKNNSEFTVGANDQALKIIRFGDAWRIEFAHPEMLDGKSLSFSDPQTGLVEAMMTSRTLLKRQSELTQTLEAVKNIENPSQLFSISKEGNINFNGKDFRVGSQYTNNFNTDSKYSLNLISKEDFVDALNQNYLETEEGEPLTASQTLETEAWRVRNNPDISPNETERLKFPWKGKFSPTISEESVEVSLDKTNKLIISKVGDKWQLTIPDKYKPLIKDGTQLQFDRFEDAVSTYEQLMPTISRAIDTLEKAKDITLDSDALEEHGTPFYYSSTETLPNRISFAGKETIWSNNIVNDPRYEPKTGYFNLSSFINGLNEIYMDEHPEVVLPTQEETTETLDEAAVKREELISHVNEFTEDEWKEVLEEAGTEGIVALSKEEYISLVKEQTTSPESWGNTGLYHLIIEVKPLKSQATSQQNQEDPEPADEPFELENTGTGQYR